MLHLMDVDVGLVVYVCILVFSVCLLMCVVMHFEDDPRVMIVHEPPSYEMTDMRQHHPQ